MDADIVDYTKSYLAYQRNKLFYKKKAGELISLSISIKL